MSESGDRTAPTHVRQRASGRPAGQSAPSRTALRILRALADAEEADAPFPTLAELATLIGASHPTTPQHYIRALSDRRLIDGYGTARRLTDAGWETLDAAGGGL